MAKSMPIACSLDGGELADRDRWIRGLGRSLLEVDAERGSARLRFGADKQPELEEFIRAESSCCSFFIFHLSTQKGTSELTITAPQDADWAVRGLVAAFLAGWGPP